MRPIKTNAPMFLIILLYSAGLLAAQTLTPLSEVGKTIERELKGGEMHSYGLALPADQFVSLTANQKGIDVVINLIGPDGARLLQIDSPNGARGPEPLWFVSERPGDYVVEIASLEKDAKPGKYEITIGQLSPADEDLRNFAAASNLVIEGVNTSLSKTPDAAAEASNKFDEAARLYELIQKNVEAKAGGFARLGRVFRTQRKNDVALKYFDKAAELHNTAGKSREMMFALIDSTSVISDTVERLRRNQQINGLAKTIGDRKTEVGSLMQISTTFVELGDYQKALETNHTALKLANEINFTERIPGILDNMGSIYTALNDFPRAIGSHAQSIELERKNGNSNPGTIMNLGNAYYGLGNYELALAAFQEALTAFERRRANVGVAYATSNLGNVYLEMGDYDRALEHFLRAQPLKAAFMPDDPTSFSNLSAVYRVKGDFRLAKEYAEKALDVSRKTGDQNAIASSFLQLARASIAGGDHRRALESLDASLEISRKFGYQDLEWQILYFKAQVLHGSGSMPQAAESLRASITVLDDLRSKAALDEESDELFSSDKQAPFRELVGVYASMGKTEDAFAAAEEGRARVLLQTVTKGRLNIVKSLTADELQAERLLRNDLVSIQKDLQNASDDASREAAQERLDAKRIQLNELRLKLYAAHPELRVQRGEIRPIGADESAALLRGSAGALLEYVVTDNRTLLFVITKGASRTAAKPSGTKLEVYSIDIGAKDLAKKVENYRTKLEKGDPDFSNDARELYRLLLKPASVRLSGKTDLVIVPDGPLWDLPFQALHNDSGGYLVETSAISYSPSLSASLEMRKRSNSRKGEPTLLAFGNPSIGNEASASAKTILMNAKLDPLPDAERLVNSLKQMYGPSRSKVFTGKDASEQSAKTEAPKYRIVQFATHGVLNNASPMYSHLVMAQNEKDTNEDGLLEAWELKDLDLKADMVILSACETARGKITGGEGVIGMTWAAFIAGAPTTVASQWKVESSSTTEFMLEFHRQMLANKKISKAEALRRASLKLMKSAKYRHPSYWAPWILVGDGS